MKRASLLGEWVGRKGECSCGYRCGLISSVQGLGTAGHTAGVEDKKIFPQSGGAHGGAAANSSM